MGSTTLIKTQSLAALHPMRKAPSTQMSPHRSLKFWGQ